MDKLRLGKTGLLASRSGFGALPIQRVSRDAAIGLLHKAFDNDINFYDTARMYTDSEEKIGAAFAGFRHSVIIATKSLATSKTGVMSDITTSLANLKTEYIDLMQLHNPSQLPDPADPKGSYAAIVEAREKGMIRHFGISNHSLTIALSAAESGLYETVQFPLSPLSSESDLSVISACTKADCGCIAMKALSGGLIRNATTSFAFLRSLGAVLPIWGIQRDQELDEFIALEKDPPLLDNELWNTIRKDRAELSGSFCRGCGYCMPCPKGIPINWAARMSLLLRRAPYETFLTDDWHAKMQLIRTCSNCGACRGKCPYGIDTPGLLAKNLEDYELFYSEHAQR
jgi:uncharacterized protein